MPAFQGYLLTRKLTPPTQAETGQANFWAEKKDYVAGGVVFNFPAGLFTAAPNVVVTVQQAGLVFAANLVVSHSIDQLDAVHVRVRVNVGTLVGGILEAESGDFIVHIMAVEDVA